MAQKKTKRKNIKLKQPLVYIVLPGFSHVELFASQQAHNIYYHVFISLPECLCNIVKKIYLYMPIIRPQQFGEI